MLTHCRAAARPSGEWHLQVELLAADFEGRMRAAQEVARLRSHSRRDGFGFQPIAAFEPFTEDSADPLRTPLTVRPATSALYFCVGDLDGDLS